MKTEASGIFSRSMSAGRKIGQRYGYANGWIRLIWHYMTKELGERIRSLGAEGQEKSKKICLYVLNRFYMEPYGETKGFYEEFYRRLEQAKKDLELKNTMYVQERIKQG